MKRLFDYPEVAIHSQRSSEQQLIAILYISSLTSQFATILINLPGTTMILRIVLPSMNRCTFSSASAIFSISCFEISAATSIFPLTLPFTCNTKVILLRTNAFSSTAGHFASATDSEWPKACQRAWQIWGAIGDTTWVNSDVNTLLAHGTEDPIVPFESGPPFQFFTLPDVYGSSLIHERLQNQGFSSELIIAEGEGHEPYGTINGSWIGPPNDFWEELFSIVQEFCFELIRPQELVISGSEFICEGQNHTYSVELAEGESVCWEIEGGDYQETSDEEIAVQITGQSAIITAFIYNEVGAASESSSIIVQASPSPDVAWDVSLEQNVLEYSVLTLFDTSWYLNGLLISEENIGSMLLKTEGEYTVSLEVVNELGCVTSYSEEFTYAIDNLDEQANSLTEVKLSSGVLSIKSEVITKVKLYDVMGRLLYEHEATEHVVSEHSGVYILSFSNSEESRAIKIVFP